MPDRSTGRSSADDTLRGWRCDVCGELITGIEDGWVEWLAREDEQGNTVSRGLRLVHVLEASPRSRQQKHGCQYDERQEFRADQSVVEGLSLELVSKIDSASKEALTL